MTVPDDAVKVLTAIRLGWIIAEVRGRNRPDAPPGAKAFLPGDPGKALPLRVEQTQTELRIEAQSVLGTMARELQIDQGKDHTDFPEAIDSQAKRLNETRAAAAGGPAVPADAAPADPDAEWLALQELIFKFDAHIQDTMASGPDTVAAGYQLGRALSEPYWALAPALPDQVPSPQAWWFLLGRERCGEMSRLAGRLTAYFHPLTAAAIAGSVQIWKHVAADPGWRKNADDELYLQTRRWYELVVMRQDPTTLVRPYALIRNFRTMRRALRIFWPEFAGIAIAAAALSGFAVLLGEHHISSVFKTALGFIAITGFSAAGLTARLKNQAQAMVTRLRQDVYTDLVAVAITTAPPVPAVPRRRQGTKLAAMARERSITPVTPN
jgi:hypothetical protein